jgi:hypothetical protein
MELEPENFALFSAENVGQISDAVWSKFFPSNFLKFHKLPTGNRSFDDPDFKHHPCSVFITKEFKEKLSKESAKEINGVCSELTSMPINSAESIRLVGFRGGLASVASVSLFLFICT